MNYPDNFRYTKEHEWVYVDLPAPGTAMKAGDTLGSVESVKAVSDIYSPISGEVLEVNDTLKDAPEKLNEDPHGTAWLVKIRLTTPSEMNGLMDSAGYLAYVGT